MRQLSPRLAQSSNDRFGGRAAAGDAGDPVRLLDSLARTCQAPGPALNCRLNQADQGTAHQVIVHGPNFMLVMHNLVVQLYLVV